jgi:hypothetical protein
LLFWDYYGIIADIFSMEGLTITEMSELLGIPYETAKVRLFRAGIKPITKDALYEKSALEAIRDVPGKGRPPKKNENSDK